MTKEIWKKHPIGVEVSSIGRVKVPQVKGHPEHITFGNTMTTGYKRVMYKKKDYRVHRLVAECFIPNKENKPFIDHINCNRSDNRVENLRWCTHKENLTFADQDVQERKAKNRDYKALARKLTNGKLSKPVLQCDLDGNIVRMWESTMECGRNGYNNSAVSACCKNKYSTHRKNIYKGYIWKYKEEVV